MPPARLMLIGSPSGLASLRPILSPFTAPPAPPADLPAPPSDSFERSESPPAAAPPLTLSRRMAAGWAPPAAGGDAIGALVQSRSGVILGRGMVLKADQFPALGDPTLPVQIPGAPNFRQTGREPVYGVAQPTVAGIRAVLDRVGAGPGSTGPAALWTNLREEPVVYVNGRPFNPRSEQHLFDNLDFPGSTADQAEARDAQLKNDVLQEAARHGGYLMIHEEGADGKVTARFEKITDVRTPAEVYRGLQAEGYHVDYARIPISDEKAPEEQDFDALTARLRHAAPDAPRIFNCHAGRGRTTTGMVAADLMLGPRSRESGILKSRAVHDDIREQGKYQRGNYKVILSLIEAMQAGPQNKADADAAIDRSAVLQNLRGSIAPLRSRSLTAPDDAGRSSARARGQDYLKRYFYIISYGAYVRDQAPKGFATPFSRWMNEHDLRPLLKNMELAMGSAPGGGAVYA